jgi:hypothetical protein
VPYYTCFLQLCRPPSPRASDLQLVLTLLKWVAFFFWAASVAGFAVYIGFLAQAVSDFTFTLLGQEYKVLSTSNISMGFFLAVGAAFAALLSCCSALRLNVPEPATRRAVRYSPQHITLSPLAVVSPSSMAASGFSSLNSPPSHTTSVPFSGALAPPAISFPQPDGGLAGIKGATVVRNPLPAATAAASDDSVPKKTVVSGFCVSCGQRMPSAQAKFCGACGAARD